MKLWKVNADINGRTCYDEENDYDKQREIYNFHKKKYISNWKSVKVSFESDSKRVNASPIKNITFFSNYSSSFICDQCTKNILSKKFSELQFLPVNPIEKNIAEKNKYYLINVLKCFDGLNYENCKFKFLLGDYVNDIIKYDIKEEAIQYPIFNLSIKGEPFRTIYATDEFKDYVEKAGLTGFVFTQVFDFNEDKN